MLRQKGKGSSFLVTDYAVDFPFMREFIYDSPISSAEFRRVLSNSLRWAERVLDRKQKHYDDLYPWRKQFAIGTNMEQEHTQ